MRSRIAPLPWPLAGLAIVVLGLVLLSVLVLPGYLVQRSLDRPSVRTLPAADRLKAENDIRATLLQGVAGLLVVLGAGAAWRQAQINREGQSPRGSTRPSNILGRRATAEMTRPTCALALSTSWGVSQRTPGMIGRRSPRS
jgi:hypothetical protein